LRNLAGLNRQLPLETSHVTKIDTESKFGWYNQAVTAPTVALDTTNTSIEHQKINKAIQSKKMKGRRSRDERREVDALY